MNPDRSVSEKNDKMQSIIEASQKRFGLFGIEKTSMREIADDLKLSKASLYYYFPDKESLYKAVVEKEQTEFLAKISERIFNFHEPDQLLLEYANARLSYFRTLLNLSRLRLEAYSDLKPGFRETIQLFKEKEKDIIKKIFEKGSALAYSSLMIRIRLQLCILICLRDSELHLLTKRGHYLLNRKNMICCLRRQLLLRSCLLKD
jgi:AcrR family transcriptional regulator